MIIQVTLLDGNEVQFELEGKCSGDELLNKVTEHVQLTEKVKMFLKPVWEGKMHGVTKIGIFCPLFCVNMLGKSTNYSTGTRPLCSTF